MTRNIGTVDQVIRLLLGLVLIVIPLLNIPPIWANGALAYATMAVGGILVATAVFRFCPLYRVIGMNTCRV